MPSTISPGLGYGSGSFLANIITVTTSSGISFAVLFVFSGPTNLEIAILERSKPACTSFHHTLINVFATSRVGPWALTYSNASQNCTATYPLSILSRRALHCQIHPPNRLCCCQHQRQHQHQYHRLKPRNRTPFMERRRKESIIMPGTTSSSTSSSSNYNNEKIKRLIQVSTCKCPSNICLKLQVSFNTFYLNTIQ